MPGTSARASGRRLRPAPATRTERTSTVQARIVPIHDVTPDGELAWRDLAGRAVGANPLFEPDCLVPAAAHQGFGADLQLAVAEEGGRFFGAFPIRRVRRWHHFPYSFVTTQVRRMHYCGTPLADPARGGEAMAVILEGLRARCSVSRGRVLVMLEVAEGGAAESAFRAGVAAAGLPATRYETWERAVVTRRDEPGYERLQDGDFRRELRRRRRKLAEELGSAPVLVDRSTDPAAVDEYIALEASGYKRAAGVAMTTVPGEPEYFREMCRRFAREGRFTLLALEAGGTTVAMQIWLRGGDGLFAVKISYDERYRRFAPGVQLQMAGLEFFHEHTDAQWIDSCTSPNHDMYLRIYPERKRIASYFVPLSRMPVDRLVPRAFTTLRPVHARLHARLRRPGAP